MITKLPRIKAAKRQIDHSLLIINFINCIMPSEVQFYFHSQMFQVAVPSASTSHS